jgi:hypothetical protein
VRVDSAGCTDFVWHCRQRNVGFAVVARSNAAIHAAISRTAFDDDRWHPAVRQDGDLRPGAAVAELTALVDLSGWPAGTRLIVRREPLHPGAQQTLFPSTTAAGGLVMIGTVFASSAAAISLKWSLWWWERITASSGGVGRSCAQAR